MSRQEKYGINDQLIREALRLELEAVTPPPVEPAWHRVVSRLDRKPAATGPRAFARVRYAGLTVAACLAIVLGGFGLFRTVQFTSPAAEEALLPEVADEAVSMTLNAEDTGVAETVRNVPGFEEIVLSRVPDPSPPDWPETLAGDYVLGEALLLTAGNEPFYRGALYLGGGAGLLTIKSEPGEDELHGFIEQLGRHLEAPAIPGERYNGLTRFDVEGRPGLAWQEANLSRAILVLDGFESEEHLAALTAEF